MEKLPKWIKGLDDEDIRFIKRFLMASGSLKQIAAEYSVTYPTVRLRLDRLIQKIQINEDIQNDAYISTIKQLALEGKLDFNTAKLLITEYRKSKGELE
ncbi:DUF2089 family protein [Marinilactibacillus psychrotolerans]|uniref:DUF2089 domain-containing protein n=1 Tax=Marinilactibacillus psychrotolerans TaxID=191770 RepID=A0AAV3WQ60_9LACT|nr:DUF2089 family protein [Marinilactibacillus psychrotolerans]GEL65939.1 hypothetical protein MPS01_00940 [Marinilactibacillus psychrotolerans]GEQ34785.1 hypothetical protein M132T_02930 [Marinilactibacillus psychrotolerans]SDC11611.1 Protein of unknown function [Marinilactibacillus psychrotolerans]